MVQPLRLLTPIRGPKVPEVPLQSLRPPASIPAGNRPGTTAKDVFFLSFAADFSVDNFVLYFMFYGIFAD